MVAYITHKKDIPNVEIYDENKHVSVQCLDEDKAHELLNASQYASEHIQLAI
jgi:hypothetical protein